MPETKPTPAEQVQQLAVALLASQARIATVESCTGGGVAALLTDLAGSSQWFDRGFVTYSNQAKIDMVGVHPATLEQYGAVSEEVAIEMAEGGVLHSEADYALSITGIAGPGGGSREKPLGMVCFAWAGRNCTSRVETKHFNGSRADIREQSVTYAIGQLILLIEI